MSPRSEDPNSLRQQVFSRVFDENWAAVRHHLECVVDDEGEVIELVSEVFLAAWLRLKPRHPMGRTWLLRAADRALKSGSSRRTARQPALDAVHQGASGVSDPADDATRAQVLRALDVLSRLERRIIMLTYWDDLAEGEVAEVVRRSRSRVRRTLVRAESKLRAELGLEGAGGDGDA